MRWLRYTLVLVVLLALESEMPRGLLPLGVGPDLLLLFALALALHGESWRVFGPMWGIGLARDALGLGPFGLYGILIGAGGMLVFLARESLFRTHVLTLVVVGALLSFLVGLTAYLQLVMGGGQPAAGPALLRALTGAALTGAVAPFLIRALLRTRALSGFVPTREMESLT